MFTGVELYKIDDKCLILLYLLRTTTGNANNSNLPRNGLVRDGTPCGENLICLNQTCTSIFPLMDQTKCPMANDLECSGHGVTAQYVQERHIIIASICSTALTKINVIANLGGAAPIVRSPSRLLPPILCPHHPPMPPKLLVTWPTSWRRKKPPTVCMF